MILTPIEHSELRAELKTRNVQFAFKKKDGTLRTAIGTTNLSNVPEENHPKGIRQSSPMVVPYFDLEKEGWRSVSITKEVFISDNLDF